MACTASRDANGTTYHIPEAKASKTPGGRMVPGCASVDVWWARQFKERQDETLLIRQESNPKQADVIELTLGQVYDLIHAVGNAVMET